MRQLLAAVSGAAVMVVELGAGRMLTPVFGSGIEVWAVVIAMTMGGLAIGYAVGGRLADQRGGLLVARSAASAGALVMGLTPLIRAPVLRLFADQSTAVGCGLACGFLLLPSLLALGMVSPALVRATAADREVGDAAGTVYAVSTAGSLVGALFAGLWALPSFSVGAVMAGSAAVLALAALGTRAGTAIAVALTLNAIGWSMWTPPLPTVDGIAVIARLRSAHGDVRVIDRPDRRVMVVNGVEQGGIDPTTGRSAYLYGRVMLALVGHYRPTAADTALVIGLGPGVIPMELQRKGVTTTSIELDPVVVHAARTWFDFDGEVHIGDGRRVLRSLDQRFDVLVVDAFLAGSPPWHLYTVEALRAYRAALSTDGVIVFNLHGNLDDPAQAPAIEAVLATARQVFPTVEAWPDPLQPASYPTRNIYVVATNLPRRDSDDVATLAALRGVEPIVGRGGTVLTDSRAGLDTLLRPTVAHIRARSAELLPVAVRVE